MENEISTYAGNVFQTSWKWVAVLKKASATALLRKKLGKDTKTDLRDLTLCSVAHNSENFDAPSRELVIKCRRL